MIQVEGRGSSRRRRRTPDELEFRTSGVGSNEHVFLQLALRLNIKEPLRLEKTIAITTLADTRSSADSRSATEMEVL